MFNSRRFETPAANPDNYMFVTIQNPACKPAKVMHSEMGGGTVYINCIPIVGRDGKPNTKEMISFRAQNKAALRTAIEKQYQASFSSTGEADVTTSAKSALAKLREDARAEFRPVSDEEKRQAAARLVRVYGHSEITLDKCLKEGISERIFNALLQQETNHYIGMVTQAHRKLAAEMSTQEQEDLTRANIMRFVAESDWKDWFKQFEGNFFGFPDYTNKNYQTLVRCCESMGFYCPIFMEIDRAMRYLLAHSHFYLQHTYKRTERDRLRQVREFVSVEPDVVPVDERQKAMESMKGLSARQLKENMQQLRSQNLTDAELRRRGSLLR